MGEHNKYLEVEVAEEIEEEIEVILEEVDNKSRNLHLMSKSTNQKSSFLRVRQNSRKRSKRSQWNEV